MGRRVEEEAGCELTPVGAHSFLIPFPLCSSPLHFVPFSSSIFSPMRKLFNRDKPKLAKVTPASREVPPDLTSANSSEVIPFSNL